MNAPRRLWHLEITNEDDPYVGNADVDADFRARVERLKIEIELILQDFGAALEIGEINKGAYTVTFELRPAVTQYEVNTANARMETTLRDLRLGARGPTPPPQPADIDPAA